MKSFSIAGIATKAFFGPHAKTFGHIPGTGPPPVTVPTLNPVGGSGAASTFAHDTPTTLAISDATRALVFCAGTVLGYSIDGGTFWTRLANTGIGAITEYLSVAAKPGGTYVLLGFDGATAHLLTSVNDGANWTDETPAGATLFTSEIFYSATAGLFFIFDAAIAEVWTSPDGIVWTNTATPAIPGNFSVFAESSTALIIQVEPFGENTQLWRSIDAKTWTVQFTHPTSTGLPGGNNTSYSAASNPPGFMVTMASGNTFETHFSSDDGVTFLLHANNGGNVDAPPYGNLIPFAITFMSAYDSDSANLIAIATSEGSAWTTYPTIPNFSGTSIVHDSNNVYAYAFGNGVLSTANGVNWGVALTAAASALDMVSQNGLTLACGIDQNNFGQIWKA